MEQICKKKMNFLSILQIFLCNIEWFEVACTQ